jgi:predicted short-subunit dehydrogenase-like oxidoreductase (DUF2520 family)
VAIAGLHVPEGLWYAAAMPKAGGAQKTVSIVGPGRLGTALALNLYRAAWRVEWLVVRVGRRSSAAKLSRQVKAQVTELGDSALDSRLVWITVPDDAIAKVANRLAKKQVWRGKVVFHSSGALTSDVLAPLRDKGAVVASVHPGMTFVSKSVPSMAGVPFGVEGDSGAVRLASNIVAELGGTAITIRKENKVLYHAFDTFASPMLIGLMAALHQVGGAAGIPQPRVRTMAGPLLRRTLENYLEHGAASALSGALIRGDVATIRRHLEALKATPHVRDAYVALARIVVRELPVANRAKLERALR